MNPLHSANRSQLQLARRILFVIASLAGCGAWLAAPASAARLLAVGCVDSHRSYDDPIVNPGAPHAAHLHEFTGSWSTSATSTPESMRASGHTCELEGDTAGYWTPALLNSKGQLIRKRFSAAYYSGDHVSDETDLHPFPAGLKIIADMNASKLSGWHCGQAGNNTELSATVVPNCEGKDDGPGGKYPDVTLLQAKVVFPDCWDGANLDTVTPNGSPAVNPVTRAPYPNDHRSHMTYSDAKKNCPAQHPVHVPRLNFKNVYDTYGDIDPKGKSSITLSSGPPSTMHADFWNTWDQNIFAKLINFCLNGDKPAGGKSLPCGDGAKSYENPNFPNPTKPGGLLFKWPPPANEDKPRIALNIADGDSLSGLITIKADSIEDVDISRIEFFVDGQEKQVRNSSTPIRNTPPFVASDSPYVLPLDTACLKNGFHTIDAEAVGITGRRGHPVPQIRIETRNDVASPPDKCAESNPGMPSDGAAGGGGMPGGDVTPPKAPTRLTAAPVSGSPTTIRLSWTASTDSDVTHYNVIRDNKVRDQSSQTTYSDTGLELDRTYAYTVQAVDAAGNFSVESNATSAVTSGSDSSAPEVSISGPGSGTGDTVSGTIRLTAEASDAPSSSNGTGISKVEFRVEGEVRRTDNSKPYTFDLDTQDLSNGLSMISATAYDFAKPKPNDGKATLGVNVFNRDETKPSTPKILKAEVTSTTVKISWSRSSDRGANATGIQYYDLLRNGKVIERDECTRSAPDDAECTTTSYTDRGLSSNTRYKYTVRAVDRSENRSSSSGSKTVRTKKK